MTIDLDLLGLQELAGLHGRFLAGLTDTENQQIGDHRRVRLPGECAVLPTRQSHGGDQVGVLDHRSA